MLFNVQNSTILTLFGLTRFLYMAIILTGDEELTYQEQLETEEWKSRRKEILERDNHCCSFCGKGQCKKLKIDHNTLYLGIDSSKPSISSLDFIDHFITT